MHQNEQAMLYLGLRDPEVVFERMSYIDPNMI